MNFVKIGKNKKSPPGEAAIKSAMTESDGTNVSVTSESDGTQRVEYSGTVNHNKFVNNLIAVVGNGSGQNSWSFLWGDGALAPVLGRPGVTGTPFSVRIQNDSAINDSSALVFQQDPTLPADVVSLAWLSKACHSHTFVEFGWTLDFNFVWGQAGNLLPGVNYQAGGLATADLTTSNEITLDYIGGGFEFGPTIPGPQHGSLFIHETSNVPGAGNPNQGCVGIGMYGQGTFVVPTQPTGPGGGRQFSIHPQYWIALGNYQQGEVVDESVLYFPKQLEFGVGLFNANCVFDGLEWTIAYS